VRVKEDGPEDGGSGVGVGVEETLCWMAAADSLMPRSCLFVSHKSLSYTPAKDGHTGWTTSTFTGIEARARDLKIQERKTRHLNRE